MYPYYKYNTSENMETCIFCSRAINNKGSLTAHQKVCKNNPNRTKFYRSPDSGAKKGGRGWSKGLKIGPHPKWKKLFPNEDIFVENSTKHRQAIKKRILDEGLIEYRCDCCGIGPYWNGNPMTLILDHKNGKNNDNRLKNLRFVCSNCDSQLETYKSRNRRKVNRTGAPDSP